MTDSLQAPDNPNRRLVLKELAAAGLVAGLGGVLDVESGLAADAPQQEVLEGYAGRLSYEPGDKLDLRISTTARDYSIEIARVGGTREIVWTKERVAGAFHSTPENAFSHGCGWPAALEVEIPK